MKTNNYMLEMKNKYKLDMKNNKYIHDMTNNKYKLDMKNNTYKVDTMKHNKCQLSTESGPRGAA